MNPTDTIDCITNNDDHDVVGDNNTIFAGINKNNNNNCYNGTEREIKKQKNYIL